MSTGPVDSAAAPPAPLPADASGIVTGTVTAGVGARGRSAPRSRNGCWTCRGRAAKKRCDEQRPVCGRCVRLGLVCDYSERPKKPPRSASARLSAASSPSSAASVMSAMSVRSVTPMAAAASPLAVVDVGEAACSITLAAEDHDAIRFFRTVFAEFHHTKHPEYGCISIMFSLAKEEPMVMHMALALGSRERDARRPSSIWPSNSSNFSSSSGNSDLNALSGHPGSRPMQHYSAALRLLSHVIGQAEPTRDLDVLLTTLWLMMLYEQQFGSSQGMANHLKGAALLVQHHLRRLLVFPSSDAGSAAISAPPSLRSVTQRSTAVDTSTPATTLSLYAVRMLSWICRIDAAAAASGVGGHFTSSLLAVLSEAAAAAAAATASATQHDDADDDLSSPCSDFDLLTTTADPGLPGGAAAVASPVDSFMRMHRHSNALYRLTWGAAYPQAELLDDLENRGIFNLMACCCPLRFMVAQLSAAAAADATPLAEEFRQRAASVARVIQSTSAAFAETLEVARELSIDTDGRGRRLASNIRLIVPVFYAIQLEFLRLTASSSSSSSSSTSRSARRRRFLLGEIMRLAFQTFRHRGAEGLTPVAWPLVVACLETDDAVHRAWILERFAAMRALGNHLARADRFLRDVVAVQEKTGARVDLREMMAQYEPFILT